MSKIRKSIEKISSLSDIGRLPGNIKSNHGGYTAAQWKIFVLLFSMYSLKDVLWDQHLHYWQSFVLACRLLCKPCITKTDLMLADCKLLHFVKEYEKINGELAVTPNMHLHLHLKECVQNYGSIYGFWLFSFESYNGVLGSYHTNNKTVEIQIMRKFMTSGILGNMQYHLPEEYFFLQLGCRNQIESKGTCPSVDNVLPLHLMMASCGPFIGKESVWADLAIDLLNKALQEVYRWCLVNRLTPHPGKSEAMIISKKTIMGPLLPLLLGDSILRYVAKTRLLGMTVDDNLTWVPHVLDLKKNFASKLELLKRSRFLPKDVLKKFYFSVILPSINYGLILWGSCCNSELINSIDRLHCRAARIIFNLPKDMASSEVMKTVNWSTIRLSYKLEIFKLMYNAYKNILPDRLCGNIFSKRENYYSLRGHEVAAICRHKTRFMKDSLSYRGPILWNLVNFNEKITNVSFKELKKGLTARDYFKDFIFDGTAVSTLRHRVSDYVYF